MHWRQYVVVRQIDGASPQPPQRFTPEEFVAWAKKQTQLADEVHCCYEAGPFGFVLHKRLVALGVKSLVVRPRNWDEYSKKPRSRYRRLAALQEPPASRQLHRYGAVRGFLGRAALPRRDHQEVSSSSATLRRAFCALHPPVRLFAGSR